MLLKEQYDYRLKTIEDRLEHQEQFMNKKINHLEDRIRSINIIYDRIDELSERINLLHTLFDKLKENFDTKLMSQDDKITSLNSKIIKLKNEDIQQLHNLIKKTSTTSKELSSDIQNIKAKDFRQSEVLFKQELRQSKILGERLQSPLLNQRIETYQKTDRMRSITLEKDKGQDIKGKQENEEEEQNKNIKSMTKTDAQKLIDKYQFTLQNKVENENQQRFSNVKIEGGTNQDQVKLLTFQQQTLLERTISQDHIPKSKDNQNKQQIKILSIIMKQKAPQISPNKLYASLLKKKNEIEQQQKNVKSPIIQGSPFINTQKNSTGQVKIDSKKQRPTSGKDLKDISTVLLKKTHVRQNSKIIETKENSQNLTQSALQLLQKIKADRPDNKIGQIQTSKEILQYHQQLIQKQYQKLLDLSKQTEHHQLQQQQQQQQLKQKLFKGPRSISNPDITTLQLCISKAHAKSIPGMLYTGQTKTNQDSYKLIQKFGTKENDWYLQVSDGHGTNGHQVSQFVQEILPAYIEQEVLQSPYYYDRDKTITNIFKQSFLKTNEDLLNSGIDVTYSGATTVVVIAFENILYCANIGDSRAIIGRYDIVYVNNQKIIKKTIKKVHNTKLSVIELSKDHKPDCFLEQARIIQRGGRVQAYSDEEGNPIGPARVWKSDEDVPGLAMSRSFGDYVASLVGVISEPEIIKHQLLPTDKFLIVASDGIWEFLSNEWVIETVNEFYKKGDCIGACNKLVQAAKEAWQMEDEVIDDITVIIAFLK